MATVRVPTDFPTIAAAMSAVNLGDTILLDPGYSSESAIVTVEGLTVSGDASSLNIDLTLGTGIIALTLGGTADIAVHDNGGDNVIAGNGGDNAITVTGGIDVVDGLTGNDRLIVDYSNAVLPIINPITNPIHAGTIDGYAGEFANVLLNDVVFDNIETFDIRGGAGNDAIMTGGGDDRLEGGPGADVLNGSDGNDTASYAHSSAGVIADLSGNGNNFGGDATGDTLIGIENLVGSAFNDILYGVVDSRASTLAGGAGDDRMVVRDGNTAVIEDANAGYDIVISLVDYTIPDNVEALYMAGAGLTGTGSARNDVLLSVGGANTLIGLAGNDFYYVNTTGDVVTEAPGGGADLVLATVNYTIPPNVEALYMAGSGLTGIGSAGSDIILSALGANTLVGLGGDDVFYVNNVADVVTEAANGGYDTVIASSDYTMPANVEALYMAGSGLTGTGSAGKDVLFSVGGANTLIGLGNDDLYHVGNTGDVVFEAANGGFDWVVATVNYTLPANAEVLEMVGSGLTGTGSAGDDTLATLGANTLIGGAGNDAFVFISGSANGGAVADFDGNQMGELDHLVFSGFGTTAQGAAFTQVGSTNQWQIHSGLDGHNEVITLANGAAPQASDFVFV